MLREEFAAFALARDLIASKWGRRGVKMSIGLLLAWVGSRGWLRLSKWGRRRVKTSIGLLLAWVGPRGGLGHGKRESVVPMWLFK